VLIEYLKEQFDFAMTPAVTLSWRHFLYGLASAMSTPADAALYRPLRPLSPLQPPQQVDEKTKLVEAIRRTTLHDPDTIARTAASLIQSCQRKILQTSPPLTDILRRREGDSHSDRI